MDHAIKYRTSDVTRRRRLRRYTDVADPEDLRAELGAARLLAAEALEQGNTALANLILNSVGKLAQTQVAVKRLKGEYLDRSVVLRIAQQIVDTVARTVQDRFVGWEAALSEAADEVSAAIASATHKPLEDRHHG